MTAPERARKLSLLKRDIAAKGGQPQDFGDPNLLAVLEVVGHDVDLAGTAIVMAPRPAWVGDLVCLGGELSGARH